MAGERGWPAGGAHQTIRPGGWARVAVRRNKFTETRRPRERTMTRADQAWSRHFTFRIRFADPPFGLAFVGIGIPFPMAVLPVACSSC